MAKQKKDILIEPGTVRCNKAPKYYDVFRKSEPFFSREL